MSNNLINSFDLWDTLIIRIVPFPQDVFTIIESHYGLRDFAKKRILAENFLYQSKQNPSIDNIYKLLDSVLNNLYIFSICGSYRRGLPQSSDIDILICDMNLLLKEPSLKLYLEAVKYSLKRK